jgi:hypothetical protein
MDNPRLAGTWNGKGADLIPLAGPWIIFTLDEVYLGALYNVLWYSRFSITVLTGCTHIPHSSIDTK